MGNPEQARTSETVVLTMTNGNGKAILGIRVYSSEYLGETDKDGRLVTFFKEPGDYELSARKGNQSLNLLLYSLQSRWYVVKLRSGLRISKIRMP